ncbi:MAG: NEAT domain-containing protein [Kurthia sp.]|nr:NEAT domain-containing protein [Candidatus Kurthia equi]
MNFKKYLVSATAAALIATSVLSVSNFSAQAADAITPTAGEAVTVASTKLYIPFNVYKAADLAEISSMERSMLTVAEVEKTADGKTFIYANLKSASVWLSFKTEVNGEMKEVETVSEDKAANTKVVKFEVTDLTKAIEANIEIQAGQTKMSHKTFLKFNTAAVAEQAFQVWDKEKAAISMGVTRSVDTKLQIVKEGDKQYAYLKLLTADFWQGLKTEVNGELVEATLVSEDKEANTKVVKFEVPSRDAIIEMESHIVAKYPGGVHDSVYKTYLDLNHVLENGQYKAVETKEFKVWNKEKTASSSMKTYMPTPAKIVKKDGKQYAELAITGANYWKGFKTSVNGELVEATIASEDKLANTRVYRFELPAYNKLIQADVHISVPGVYDTTHTTYLDFANIVKDASTTPAVNPNKVVSTTKYNYSLVTKTKKAKSVANPYVVKPLTVKKTQSGKYYATVKLKNQGMWSALKTEVDGKMVNVTTVSKDVAKKTRTVKFQVKSPTAVVKTTFKLNTKSKKLAGSYTNYFKLGTKYVKAATVTSTKKYNYSALKEDKKSVSATDSYMVKPVTIQKMSDGKYYATLTIKNASLWKSFKTEVNGKLVEVTTVSSDKKKDTKVVKFQVKSPTATIKTSTHIKFNGYDNTYTNYLKLGTEVKK